MILVFKFLTFREVTFNNNEQSTKSIIKNRKVLIRIFNSAGPY